MGRRIRNFAAATMLAASGLSGCGTLSGNAVYFNPEMDFSFVQTVAVMPFRNLTNEEHAANRVRDTFMTMLLAEGVLYVLPSGEVARGVARLGIADPTMPSSEEVKSLAGLLGVNAVMTGVVREYGAVRSGTAEANLVSASMQMMEAELGRVVWSASSTKGGVNISDRLFGGGGKPMNDVTMEAVRDLLNQLFE